MAGDLRAVSVEVYNDTPEGAATIYIVGELNPSNPENINIPGYTSDWHNIYNVRWSKSIVIDPASPNSQPIHFYKQPSIEVSEIFRGFIDTITSSVQTTYLTASHGDPREGFEGYIP